jgi:TRAP-type C4-dicarboxylate transport system permease small subunit
MMQPERSSATEETDRFQSVRSALFTVTRVVDLVALLIVLSTLTFMFGALLVNVILRYAFNGGITWAYEIHAILLPWMVAGGATMAAARGRNIAVELLVDMLPDGGRRVMSILVHGLVVIMAVSVIDSSFPIIKAAKFSRLAETGIPQMYGYLSLLYAFGMIALLATLDALRLTLGEPMEITDPTQTNYS